MDNEGTSGLNTPVEESSTPPYIHFTPKSSAMTSFDNLVALANYYERLEDARKIVWRDRGEPVVELRTLADCLAHAARGGARAFSIAFNIRAAINLVLALMRISRVPGDLRLRVLLKQVFGKDTLRFASMLGAFVSIYKFLLNVLPLCFPSIDPQHDLLPTALDTASPTLEVPLQDKGRKARLSLSKNAKMVLIRKRTRKWHAALAGAIAGALAIMLENRAGRASVAQQVFVRGLQGSYNSFTKKRGIKVPHGDVLVFSLACGQIMYAFMMRPETLTSAYNAWIQHAAKVPKECVRINRPLVRRVAPDLADVDRVLQLPEITPANITDLLAMRDGIINGPLPRYASCATNHPHLSSCMSVPIDRFVTVFKWMFPIYGALHFAPVILFKPKAFLRDPGSVLVKAGMGTTRSATFLGVFVIIYQTLFCYKNYLHRVLGSSNVLPAKLKHVLMEALVGKAAYWFLGLACGLSALIEEKRRRAELAMYVLPKALESVWAQARGKGLVSGTGNWGEILLTSVGMGMMMGTYQNDPQHLSGIARRILYQFIGPN